MRLLLLTPALFFLASCAEPEPVLEPTDADTVAVNASSHQQAILAFGEYHQKWAEDNGLAPDEAAAQYESYSIVSAEACHFDQQLC